MKNLFTQVSGILCAVIAYALPSEAAVITFDELSLSQNSNFHSAQFSSGSASFNNSYIALWDSWEGFAYSNMGDTTTPGFGNQYSSFAGGAAEGSGNFALGFVGYYTPFFPTITLAGDMDTPLSIQVTNTTFTALTMQNGDQFSKKFGGASGNDPDYYRLTITGLDSSGLQIGSVDFYLADYRFADNTKDYIVNTWQTVDLSSLGSGVRQLVFTVDSSDAGASGINTPTYFAIDNVQIVPEPSACLLVAIGMAGLTISRRRFRH